jgi:hypothetical protein
MSEHKILFILKKRRVYDMPNEEVFSSGLYNSALFVNDMLNQNGIESKLVQVNDNNDIDREVYNYKPTDVIIEALWVVPEKFDILHTLHPNVKWYIRLHSEIPFISNESIAIDWLFKYNSMAYNKIKIAVNSEKMLDDLNKIGINHVVYMPNYYPVDKKNCYSFNEKNHIDIGCFGAIRPMKNQLIQAIAAIDFGNKINKEIHFHINSSRIERGDSVLINIKALFENQKVHKLIEHSWLNHDEFILLIRQMDLGLQVSFNETFNIVAADFVNQNIPVIGSKEISWLNYFYKADATDSNDIMDKLRFANYFKITNLQKLNKKNLINISDQAKNIWCDYFK